MRFRRFAWAVAAWCGCLLPLQAQPDHISDKARQQIAELMADADARTPAQRKLASHLIYAARTSRGQRITPSIATLPLSTGILHMRGELVEVDLKGDITDALLSAVTAAGGKIEVPVPEYHALRAWIPLRALETLAARDDVRYIVPASVAQTASHPVEHPKPAPTLRNRTGVLFSRMSAPPFPDQGGIIAHGADLVQAMGYTGQGIKVGVMSDGVNSLAGLQQQGYLPLNITVVPGQAGNGDEGTALMNVVYNMADQEAGYRDSLVAAYRTYCGQNRS